MYKFLSLLTFWVGIFHIILGHCSVQYSPERLEHYVIGIGLFTMSWVFDGLIMLEKLVEKKEQSQ